MSVKMGDALHLLAFSNRPSVERWVMHWHDKDQQSRAVWGPSMISHLVATKAKDEEYLTYYTVKAFMLAIHGL